MSTQDTPDRGSAPATIDDAEIRTYRGRSLAELAPQIRAELGDAAVIVRQREGVTGGFAGFFAKRCVEVDVLVAPELGPAATQRASLIDTVDGPAALPGALGAPPQPVAPALFAAAAEALEDADGAAPSEPPAPAPAAAERSVGSTERSARPAPSSPAELSGGVPPLGASPLAKFRVVAAKPAASPPLPAEPPAAAAPVATQPPAEPSPGGPPIAAQPSPPAPEQPPVAEPPVAAQAALVAEPPVAEQAAPAAASAPVSFEQRLREIQDERDQFEARQREHRTPAGESSEPAGAATEAGSSPAPGAPAPAVDPAAAAAGRDLRELEATYQRLVDAGLPESLTAAMIDDALSHRRALEPGLPVRKAVVEELAARIGARPLRGRQGAAVAFVGPPGTGKTRAIARLAAAYTAAGHQPVACVSVSGSSDDGVLLHALAPFGVPMHAVDSPQLAAERIAALRAAGRLVLVDTPGVPPVAPEQIAALAEQLAPLQLDRVLLCLPISHGASVVAKVISTLSPLHADALLLTRADEAASPGGAIAASIDAGLPLAYVSGGTGRGAIVPASARRLAKMMLTGKPLQATEIAVPAAPFMHLPTGQSAPSAITPAIRGIEHGRGR